MPATRSLSPSLRRRVCTLPRHSSMTRSGRSQRSCRARRMLLVPMTAPCGRASKVRASLAMSTSAVGARSRTAVMARPGGLWPGRSFRLWTATSMVPPSRASSSSLVKSPFPPASAARMRLRSSFTSPRVTKTFCSTSSPGSAASKAARVSSACASASAEPRVPRMKRVIVFLLPARSAKTACALAAGPRPARPQTPRRAARSSARRW